MLLSSSSLCTSVFRSGWFTLYQQLHSTNMDFVCTCFSHSPTPISSFLHFMSALQFIRVHVFIYLVIYTFVLFNSKLQPLRLLSAASIWTFTFVNPTTFSLFCSFHAYSTHNNCPSFRWHAVAIVVLPYAPFSCQCVRACECPLIVWWDVHCKARSRMSSQFIITVCVYCYFYFHCYYFD